MSGPCGKMGDEKLAKRVPGRYPESRGEMGARKKTEIVLGDCIKSDLERVGEEWNKL